VDRVLEDIKTRMSEPVCLPDGNRITISVSVGVAIFPQDGRNSTELLARADAAMYAYKSRTRQIGKQGRR
jgi:GGDEF domain-containing protein